MSASPRIRAALAVAPLLALACSSLARVPLAPSEDGVVAVEGAQLQLRAEVRPGEHRVPNTLMPIEIPYAVEG